MLDQTPLNNSQSIKGTDFSSQFKLSPVPMHTHNGTDSQKIAYSSLSGQPKASMCAVLTNGTTSVSVIPIVPLNCTITGIFISSMDTTAGNITISNNGASVAVIAKSTTAGVMTGSGTLSNTKHIAGQPITVVSSSAGNSTVFITFNL